MLQLTNRIPDRPQDKHKILPPSLRCPFSFILVNYFHKLIPPIIFLSLYPIISLQDSFRKGAVFWEKQFRNVKTGNWKTFRSTSLIFLSIEIEWFSQNEQSVQQLLDFRFLKLRNAALSVPSPFTGWELVFSCDAVGVHIDIPALSDTESSSSHNLQHWQPIIYLKTQLFNL